jgi:hypothetical protein
MSVSSEGMVAIGHFQGRPVYQTVAPEGGDANSNAAGANAGGPGGAGVGSTEEIEVTPLEGGDGGSSGGSDDSGSANGTPAGTAPASSVDGSSSDAGSGQPQTSGDLDGLRKALAAERTLRRTADKALADERKKSATAEELAIINARETSAAETETRVKIPLLRALAATELRASGVQGATARLVGLLDLSKVEIDEDGDPIGLTEQIESLKTDFPNLFQAATGGQAPRPGNANGGSGARSGRAGDSSGGQPPRKFNEILADIVLTGGTGAGTAMR